MTPKVTVSLVTYNHAQFIERAIEGILMQRTNFPFEVLIGEDDSSDGTREIVRRYAERHPEKIRVFFHDKKDKVWICGKPTGRRNLHNNLFNARGQYIALLEGDDYWISPDKLQRQADLMDAHPELSQCGHLTDIREENGTPHGQMRVRVKKDIYSLEDYLADEVQIGMCATFIRRDLLRTPAWFWRTPMLEVPLRCMLAQYGPIGFIHEAMSVYQIHAGGIWSEGQTTWNAATRKRRLEEMLIVFDCIREELGPRGREQWGRRVAAICSDLVWNCSEQDDEEGMQKWLIEAFRASPLPAPGVGKKFLVKSAMLAYLPGCMEFRRWWRSRSRK